MSEKDNELSAAIGKMFMALGVVALAIFFAPLIGVVTGAFSGWVVSLLAPGWVVAGANALGFHITPNDLVSIGAALGFGGGFFKSYLRERKQED